MRSALVGTTRTSARRPPAAAAPPCPAGAGRVDSRSAPRSVAVGMLCCTGGRRRPSWSAWKTSYLRQDGTGWVQWPYAPMRYAYATAAVSATEVTQSIPQAGHWLAVQLFYWYDAGFNVVPSSSRGRPNGRALRLGSRSRRSVTGPDARASGREGGEHLVGVASDSTPQSARTTLPAGSITNVERLMPMDFSPWVDPPTQTPYRSATEASASENSVNSRPYLSLENACATLGRHGSRPKPPRRGARASLLARRHVARKPAWCIRACRPWGRSRGRLADRADRRGGPSPAVPRQLELGRRYLPRSC